MRVPVSWLRALVPALTASADEIAAALVRAGLEVEQVHRYGHDVSGVVTGETEMLASGFVAEVGSEDNEYKIETELIKLKKETNAR